MDPATRLESFGSLKDGPLAVFVAVSAKHMEWLSLFHSRLQRISVHSRTDFVKIVAALLCGPCFKLGFFFFKLAYSVQQRRLRRLGLHCVALGGKDLSSEFENLRLDEVRVVDIFHSLRNFHGRSHRGHETGNRSKVDHGISPPVKRAIYRVRQYLTNRGLEFFGPVFFVAPAQKPPGQPPKVPLSEVDDTSDACQPRPASRRHGGPADL